MTLLASCGHVHRPRRVELTDAPTRADPTGTSRLRARMRAEGDRRWQVLARTLRQALIEHDLVGLRGMGRLPHGDKAEGFAVWLREELRQKVFGLDGRWVKPYVAEAAAIAGRRASEMAGGAVDPARVTSMGSVAVSELRGITEAAQQQLTRCVTHCMMANATPTRTANAAAGAIKTMRNRTRAMSEYIVAKTHATSTLSAFRNAGVTHVGVIPERLRKKRLARPAAHGKVLDRDDLPSIEVGTASVETESRWLARFAELERLHGRERALELLQREIAAEGRGLRTGAAEFGAALRAGTEEFVARRAEEGAAAKAERAARESSGLEPRAEAFALPRLEAEIAAEGARLKTAAAEFGAGLRAGTAKYVARRAAEGAAAKVERLARTRPEEIPGIERALEIGGAEKAQAKLEKAFGGAEAEVDVITAGDDDVCPECEDISDSGPYSLDEAEGLIPAHPNCLPANTLVLARHGVLATSERWYAGQLIVIKTASGRFLSCTPNHPVLTDRGWVAANFLDVGDNVISDGGCEWEGAVAVVKDDYQHVPTCIHDVARAFIEPRKMLTVKVPTASPDFHGDGMQGEVAVIRTNSKLRNRPMAAFSQHSDKLGFAWRDVVFYALLSFCSAKQVRLILLRAANRVVRRLNLALALLWCHLFPFQRFGFAAVSMSNSVLGENSRDDTAANVQSVGNSQFRHATLVKQNNLLGVESQDFGFGQVSWAEHPLNRFSSEAVFAHEIADGKAGPVFLDKLVDVGKINFAGHVYNLQTPDGHYSAAGIITHNCRCAFAPAGQYEKDALLDYDPDQPRDPDGKFAGSGAQPALAGAEGPHSAVPLRSRLGNFVKSGQAKVAIASAATKALGAAKAHQADLLGYAVTAGLYHVAGIDFPVEVEAAIHSEVEHLAQNLGVAKSAAVAMMKDAVGRLQGLRAK